MQRHGQSPSGILENGLIFTVISPLCILSQVKFISPVRQFHGKSSSVMVIPPKYGRIWVSLSFSLVHISLVDSVTIANGQNEWS